jgi:hypothetical protein
MAKNGTKMSNGTNWMRGLAAVGMLFALGACASTKGSASIQRVDDLVTRVEAVHVEAELAKAAIYDTLLALRPVLTPTEGDPKAQFDTFLAALDAAEASAQDLDDTIRPMEQSARQVFLQWEQDLREFSNDGMRERSRDRMQATRSRYDAVLRSARGASEHLDEWTASLRDIALFLAHDFNSASIHAIQSESVVLRDEAKGLGQELDRCMQAAELYVREAAPLGVSIQAPPAEPAPAAPTAPARTKAAKKP